MGVQLERGHQSLKVCLLALLVIPAPLFLAETRVDAQATIRADGVQLQVRRLPDAIELVIQDAGAGGALEQRRDGSLWTGELRTDRIRGLKSGPQSLAMPDAGMERITFDGTGRLFELKVAPVKGQTLPAPVVSSDGKNLVVRFEAPLLPIAQTARPNLSTPVPVPTPAFIPPLRPRASAPPVGDMAVGSMVIRNRAYVNLSGPPVTMTTRGANARDVLMVLAQMGGYGFAYSDIPATSAGSAGTVAANVQPGTTTAATASPVTVAFRGEPYERAFNFVLLTAGLQARKEGNTILVGPNVLSKSIGAQLSKVYRLNQVGPNEAADYLANLGAQVTKTNTITTASSEGVTQTNSVANAPSAQTTTSTTITAVESYGAATGPLLGLNATTDTRLGTITLFGESSLISIAEQYLRQLDLRQRQVALTVRILDVNLSNVSEIDNSFALRFGNNFIVNDRGQLVAAFGSRTPFTDQDGNRSYYIPQNEIVETARGSNSFSGGGSSSERASSRSSGESVQQGLNFQLTNQKNLTQSQIEEINAELSRVANAAISSERINDGTNANGVSTYTITTNGTASNSSSVDQSFGNGLQRTISEIISSVTGSDVTMQKTTTRDLSQTSGASGQRNRGSSRNASSDASSTFGYGRNPGLNYPDNQFYDFLRAQIVSSNTKILASPTLILQEGKSVYEGSDDARISEDGKIGRSKTNEALIAIGTKYITKYEVKQGDTGPAYCEATLTNAGITFGARVDKIDDNGFVTFSLSPEISAPVGQESSGNCGNITLISQRALDTGKLRVRDGQTLILTGVISSTDIAAVSKWPVLGDLPLIGQFFRRSSSDRKKNELVIMVTPRIINDEEGGVYGYGYQPSTQEARGLLYKSSTR